MLTGEYQTILGEKNRIAIPKKIREKFEGEIFLTRGFERCLIMMDRKRWDSFNNEINKSFFLSSKLRETKRFILGGALEIEPDSQGRFVISEALKNFGMIEDQVTFLGVGEWVEVWNSDKWLNKLKDLSDKVTDLAEKLSA